MTVLVLNWCSLSHDAYGYVIIANNQLAAKSTVLMTSIYQTEGYEEGVPVVLIGDRHTPFYEDNSSSITGRGDIRTIKNGTQGIYRATEIVYTPTHVEKYLNLRLGAGFAFVDRNAFYSEHRDECSVMPAFPKAGSIVMMDGTIVVKLSDMQ